MSQKKPNNPGKPTPPHNTKKVRMQFTSYVNSAPVSQNPDLKVSPKTRLSTCLNPGTIQDFISQCYRHPWGPK